MRGLRPEDRPKKVLNELIEIVPLKPDKIRSSDILEKSSFSRYAVYTNLKKGVTMGLFERTPKSTHKNVHYWRVSENPKIELSLKDISRRLREARSIIDDLYTIRDEIKEIQPTRLEKRDKDDITKLETTKVGDRCFAILIDCFKMLYEIYIKAFDLPINKDGEKFNINICDGIVFPSYQEAEAAWVS